ncbi:hypothetical protein [Acaryochloris sp. CCMEE 5410]|uniref:hypothetical protein n=1 Tax=Acaryochloris sp. CCMEE 5410 TaxID=310037 RepID=UPI0002D8697F|nr:hypothetical protein [Acaryochloris sp. CCMEE 5410]KAI9131161.1 hypothetical protein ON05_026205 [Acaryochloris sp. CCMEE 5410]
MLSSTLLKKLIAPTLTAICAVGVSLLQFSALEEVEAQENKAQPKSFYIRETNKEKANLQFLKRMPKFGYDNVIADWAFLRFLQYFGDQKARKQVGYALSTDYFEIFVDRNPQFTEPYKFMSPATSIFAGRPDKSVKLINQGLQSLSPESSPNAYTIWISKASDELLFLGNNQAAKNSYLQAAKWAKNNPDPEAQRISAIVTQTAKFLSQNPDSKNVRISAWMMIFRNAVDDETRQRSIAEIEKLGAQVIITENNVVKIQFPNENQ